MSALERFADAAPEALWRRFGAQVDGDSVRFTVWAPHAAEVRVIGDFNDWDGRVHTLARSDEGVWSIRVGGLGEGTLYQYEIISESGGHLIKSDPFAQYAQLQPQRSSIVYTGAFSWSDDAWLAARTSKQPHAEAMSVYEVHLGSWRRGLSYSELGTELVDYVTGMGFTHVEFLPVMEHPFIGSWGYQVTGYFAPTSRYGTPDQLRALINALHEAGIGVIMDWVPAHFPKDEWGLGRFDGHALYEPTEFDEHPDWGTYTFDFAKPEVRSFLIANALYWLEEFHVDGLRVDAVASMLYLDYSRGRGAWKPNKNGGAENLDAVQFLQELNSVCYLRNPGIAMIAEDSTTWPGVTLPAHLGGLGFGFKWNLGWMHDTLQYLREDPISRQFHHRQMTLPMMYAYSDNYILPLSHDEVVHGKGSLVRKISGDRPAELATLRAYLAFMWAHPGKKLLFMGSEFGHDREWSEKRSLDWDLLDDPAYAGVQSLVRDLNAIYRDTPALWRHDYEPDAFGWIESNDSPHNVFSFARTGDNETIVCVSNFAGIDHEAYDLGLPWAGEWKLALNSSAASYAGRVSVLSEIVDAEDVPHQGCPASTTIHLPALGTIWLTSVNKSKSAQLFGFEPRPPCLP